ncbi:hypothetical protein ACGFT2_26760 [Streptomyces sp. NPDC048514]|uniref:hypothetical protein n=1 Tax=Streptomyces sp. NPDC048514 TaxID=3365564 RepID=UPI00371A7EB6
MDNPYTGCDPLGLMPKYTKEERTGKRLDKIVDEVADRAQNGQFKKHLDYHGDTRHGFTDERVMEILRAEWLVGTFRRRGASIAPVGRLVWSWAAMKCTTRCRTLLKLARGSGGSAGLSGKTNVNGVSAAEYLSAPSFDG